MGDNKPLARRELDNAVFEIDEQFALDHIEELVISVVLVPVILAFDDADAHHRLVDFAESLIEPLELTGIGERLLVDYLERRVQGVETGFVGIIGG
jgi:hypothetical protein